MKKNLLSILLALVLVLGLTVLAAPAVSAEETTDTTAHAHCYCVNAEYVPEDHVCINDQEWTALVGKEILDSGYYYLNWTGVKATSLTINADQTVYLCLNGAQIRAQTVLTLGENAKLIICDCSDGKTGIVGTTKNATIKLAAGNELTLYSGTITGANTPFTTDKRTAISVNVGAGTVTMYGGTINNGISTNHGGNVLIGSGSFTMYGGTICDGKATNKGGNIALTAAAGRFYMYGGTISGGEAGTFGGNISMNNGAQVVIDGEKALITAGKSLSTEATQGGGNIHIHHADGKFTLNNGTVSKGEAASHGGNIYTENGTVEINGGTISAGVASADGGNIYLTKDMTISGGVIENGTATNDGGNLYISDSAVATISGGSFAGGTAKNGGSICVKNDVALTGVSISGGTATGNGGNIWSEKVVTIGEGTVISGGSATNGGNICATGTGANLIMSAGKIENGTASNGGGNAYTYNAPKVMITGGEVSNGTAAQGGNLYITHTTQVATRRLTVSNAAITGGNATDGNGGNLYASRVGVITLTDVTMTDGVATTSGSNIYVQLSNQVNISGGTYSVAAGNRNYTYDSAKHSKYTQEEIETYGLNVAGTRIPGKGGNICINSIQDFETSKQVDTGEVDAEGNAIMETETTVHTASGSITGATILGGNAVDGGALYIGSGAVTLDGITAKSCGGESGRVMQVAKGATVTLKDSTMVNWGTKGTALTNKGTLILVGTINLNKEHNAAERLAETNGTAPNVTLDIVVDCIDNADAVLDITGLTAVDETVTVNRLGTEDADGTKHTAAGLVAIGANETNAAMLVCSHAAYKLVQDGTNINLVAKAVWGMDGTDAVIGYESLADIAEDDGATWYALNADLADQTISKTMMLDLCGYDLSAEIAEGVVVSLIDSANDKYDASACGKLTKTGTGTVESIVHTTGNAGGAVKHYVVLKNADGTYSAHRYVAAVTSINLKPADDAMGYKATFNADEVARAAVKDYGIRVWVNEDHKIAKATTKGFDQVGTTLTLRVKNILAANGGEMDIYGDAFITFNVDGEEIFANASSTKSNMKTAIETIEKEMEAGTATYTAEQITAVKELLSKFASKVSSWDINYIQAWTAETETTDPSEPATEATEAA